MLTILFVCLVVLSADASKLSADRMRELARSPEIDAAIRGKTLKELGVQQALENRERRRAQFLDDTEPELTLSYFSVSTILYEASRYCRKQSSTLPRKMIFLFHTSSPTAIFSNINLIFDCSLGLRRIRNHQHDSPR